MNLPVAQTIADGCSVIVAIRIGPKGTAPCSGAGSFLDVDEIYELQDGDYMSSYTALIRVIRGVIRGPNGHKFWALRALTLYSLGPLITPLIFFHMSF